MNIFGKKKPEPAEDVPAYSYCEGVWVTGNNPQHIRRINPEVGQKFGGGADTPTLCDTDLRGGWDLPSRVGDPAEVNRLAETIINGNRVVCRGCADAYITI